MGSHVDGSAFVSSPYRQMLGRGMFTQTEAAQLLRLNRDVVARWVSPGKRAGALFQRDYPKVDGRIWLSFDDLMELRVVKYLCDRGISTRRIRRVIANAAELVGSTHPFSSGRARFLSDGRTLAIEDGSGLADLQDKQVLIEEVVSAYFDEVELDDDERVIRWFPDGRDGKVVVDPALAAGKPVVRGTATPVSTLADFVRAGDSPELIARAYGLDASDVHAAVEWHQRLAA